MADAINRSAPIATGGASKADTGISFPLKVKGKGEVFSRKSFLSDVAAYQQTLAKIEQAMLHLRQSFGKREVMLQDTRVSIALHLWKAKEKTREEAIHMYLRWFLTFHPQQQQQSIRTYILTSLPDNYQDPSLPQHETVVLLYNGLQASPLMEVLIQTDQHRLLLNTQARAVRWLIRELEGLINYQGDSR